MKKQLKKKDLIVESAIQDALIRPTGKVDWSNSPFLPVKLAGKNAVGDFGEFCFKHFSDFIHDNATIIKKEHDVVTKSDKKVEVKTAFKGKTGSFFFNQIYYQDPQTNKIKDWDHLVFVFVEPHRIEMWECKKPTNPEKHFTRNNGWCWNRSSSDKLDKQLWAKIYERECE